MAFSRTLDDAARERFEDQVQHFIVTKTWSSDGGEVTDEMKVVVAAVACRLTLALPWEQYGSLRHVQVRRDAARDGVVGLGARTSVTLSWPTLLRDLENPDGGDNVGYHEFAHVLDGADGSIDGEPNGPPGTVASNWVRVIAEARAEVRRAPAPVIGTYAGTSDAELFAVATEWFFGRPDKLAAEMPALYAVLRAFYRQDPARSLW